MYNYGDKIVLITGAGSGIGKKTGEMLLKEGATVIGTIIEDFSDFTEKSVKYPGKCFTKKLDVTDSSQIERVAESVISEFGRIDILINNAGIHMNATVLNTTESQWDKMFDTNVKSVFLMCKNVLPHMLNRKQGVIINTASRVGNTGSPNSAAYCASKAAVANLTREMALDFSDKGIRILAIAPGMVETPMLDRQFLGEPERKQSVMMQYPQRRFSDAEEIANTILFLASDKASNITGAVIPVDGGRSAL